MLACEEALYPVSFKFHLKFVMDKEDGVVNLVS